MLNLSCDSYSNDIVNITDKKYIFQLQVVQRIIFNVLMDNAFISATTVISHHIVVMPQMKINVVRL